MGKHENAPKKHQKLHKNRLRGATGIPWGPLGDPSKNKAMFGDPFLTDFLTFFADFGEPWGPPFSHLFGPNCFTLRVVARRP